jgi:hypothetical protein
VEPALSLTAGEEVFTFDDDEHCALSEMNFLYGQDGAKPGRTLVESATLSEREVLQLAMFLENVRLKLNELLVVYDHGHGFGTVCFQHRPWYELVKRSGIRYLKPTPRYVKGQKGKLESIDDVVYVRGRRVRDPEARAQALGDLPPLRSALEKLARAVAHARSRAPLRSAPRQTYEHF